MNLREIARDIYKLEIFCSIALPPEDMHLIPVLFRPAAINVERKMHNGLVIVYEYLDKAVGIHEGYPRFDTMQVLVGEDVETVMAVLNELIMMEYEIVYPEIGGRLCDVCGKQFTPDEWEKRHFLHTENCWLFMSDGPGECDCDIQVHELCCKVCQS